MAQQPTPLAELITKRLTEHTEQNGLARSTLHEMLSELATEIMSLQSQVSDLRTLTSNQGLAVHQVDGTLARHMLLPAHSPLDAE